MSMMRVSASHLKAKLGKYLRAVRGGKVVVVTDRDLPVARLIPFGEEPRTTALSAALPRDPTAPPLGSVAVHAIPHRRTDTTAVLREDRDQR
jgi:prevent-host-death family protein